MRTFGNISAEMGASIHEGHPDTLQSTETNTDPSVLRGGRRQTSPSLGSRSVACVVTPLYFPVLRRPRCVPFQYQSYSFQRGHIMDQFLYSHVHVHHIHADILAQQSILRPAFSIGMVSLQWITIHTVPNSRVDHNSIQVSFVNPESRIPSMVDLYATG